MVYQMKMVKSFKWIETEKIRFGLLAGFLVTLTYLSMSNSNSIPFPTINSRLSARHDALSSPIIKDTMNSQQLDAGIENITHESKPRCDDASDQSLALCKKTGVILRTNENSTTVTSGATLSAVGEGNSTQNLEKNGESLDRSPISDGSKNGGRAMDGDARVVKNSSSTIISSESAYKKETIPEGSRISNVSTSPERGMDGDGGALKNTSIAAITFDATQKENTTNAEEQDRREDVKPKNTKSMCDFSNRRSNICEMDGDIRIHGKSSSIVFVEGSQRNESWRVKPYPRKTDPAAMGSVKELSVRSSDSYEHSPTCTLNHSIPAIVFSVGGYSGNYFHAFTDVFIPLFLTSHQFDGEVQFVVTNFRAWWINKFLPIFKKLSRYEMIDLDNDDRVHCFRHAIVGLKAHDDLTIDPSISPNGYSMVDFTKFMRSTYSLPRDSPVRVGGESPSRKKPRLLIVARGRTRRFTNLSKIVRMAEKLGFEVVAAEAEADVAHFASIVNSCDVMMGVHGAGLTNLVFLPTNAILIQIVPFGRLEWIAGTYFRNPAKDMKLKYLEYSITEDESTLKELYPRDHPVFKDPMSYHKQGWLAMGEIYLVQQNVKLNVRRFRPILLEALKLLRG